MKTFWNRFSRVSDSSQYTQLGTDVDPRPRRRATTFSPLKRLHRSSNGVPVGHLPVYVGEEMQRYIISATLLHNPIIIQLLDKSAEEYGYEQKGVLRIPCNVPDFETLLVATRTGVITQQVHDILSSL